MGSLSLYGICSSMGSVDRRFADLDGVAEVDVTRGMGDREGDAGGAGDSAMVSSVSFEISMIFQNRINRLLLCAFSKHLDCH
jgi:hypothetical protein